jgi:hypothetical protein
MKLEAIWSLKILLPTYKTIWLHKPDVYNMEANTVLIPQSYQMPKSMFKDNDRRTCVIREFHNIPAVRYIR